MWGGYYEEWVTTDGDDSVQLQPVETQTPSAPAAPAPAPEVPVQEPLTEEQVRRDILRANFYRQLQMQYAMSVELERERSIVSILAAALRPEGGAPNPRI